MSPEYHKAGIRQMSGVAKFAHSLRQHPDRIHAAADAVFGKDYVYIPAVESSLTDVGLHLRIRMRQIDRHAPDWLNRDGVVTMVKEVFSSHIWKPLLDEAPKDIQRGVKRHTLSLTNASSASGIGTNNSRVGTASVVIGLLGAAIGEPIADAPRLYSRKDPFALEIASHYPNPSQTPDEFFERVQELLPNPETPHEEDRTLMRTLLENQGFRSSSPRRRIVCPAIFTTGVLLEAWGRNIATNQTYRDRFLATVAK